MIVAVATVRASTTALVVVEFVTSKLVTALLTAVEVPTVKFEIVVLPAEKTPLTVTLPLVVISPWAFVKKLVFSIHV